MTTERIASDSGSQRAIYFATSRTSAAENQRKFPRRDKTKRSRWSLQLTPGCMYMSGVAGMGCINNKKLLSNKYLCRSSLANSLTKYEQPGKIFSLLSWPEKTEMVRRKKGEKNPWRITRKALLIKWLKADDYGRVDGKKVSFHRWRFSPRYVTRTPPSVSALKMLFLANGTHIAIGKKAKCRGQKL